MKHISTLLIQLWKKQTVLCIAGLAALLSAFPVSFSPCRFCFGRFSGAGTAVLFDVGSCRAADRGRF